MFLERAIHRWPQGFGHVLIGEVQEMLGMPPFFGAAEAAILRASVLMMGNYSSYDYFKYNMTNTNASLAMAIVLNMVTLSANFF